jgi:hypothetical protein
MLKPNPNGNRESSERCAGKRREQDRGHGVSPVDQPPFALGPDLDLTVDHFERGLVGNRKA